MYLARNYYGFVYSVGFSVVTSLYSDLVTKQSADHKQAQSRSVHLMRHCSDHKNRYSLVQFRWWDAAQTTKTGAVQFSQDDEALLRP